MRPPFRLHDSGSRDPTDLFYILLVQSHDDDSPFRKFNHRMTIRLPLRPDDPPTTTTRFLVLKGLKQHVKSCFLSSLSIR